LGSFDARLYLDVNLLAQRTVWAHSLMRVYATYVGLILLGCLVLVALWRARGGALSFGERDTLPDAVWTPIAALAAFGIAILLAEVIGRARPYAAIHQHVEVLVPRVSGASLPSEYAAVAGALLVGTWLTRDRVVALLVTVVGLFMCLAQVYVGSQYVGDELAGIGLGVVLSVALRPLALPVISLAREGLSSLARPAPLMSLPGSSTPDPPSAPGKTLGAAVDPRPAKAERSGAVRILEADARLVPHVENPRRVGRTSVLEPATAHVHKVAPPGNDPSEVPITGT
jgi:hypothetical protein